MTVSLSISSLTQLPRSGCIVGAGSYSATSAIFDLKKFLLQLVHAEFVYIQTTRVC